MSATRSTAPSLSPSASSVAACTRLGFRASLRRAAAMLDIQFIRQNADQVRAAIKNKGFTLDLDALLAADRERRDATTALELKRARKNELSAAIPKASKDERPPLVEEAKQIRAEIEALEPALGEIQK